MLSLSERMDNCSKKKTSLKESLNQSNGLLLEMAKLNHKDSGTSEFPPNLFRVWVQGDGSVNKPPHIHISNLQEGWEIKVYIETGELWNVVYFGRRKRRDNFQV